MTVRFEAVRDDLRCEVCGEPASAAVQDLITNNKAGDVWRTYDRAGRPHLLCTAHDRPAVRVDLLGLFCRCGRPATHVADLETTEDGTPPYDGPPRTLAEHFFCPDHVRIPEVSQ